MRSIQLAIPFAVLGLTTAHAQDGFGGGLLPEQTENCIRPEERDQAEQDIALYHAKNGYWDAADGAPALYPFHPQAGNLWGDLFINNFVDLGPAPGILDWDCTDWTYQGHTGHDADLRSFSEQEIGVPVFAALDGEVVDTHDGEFDRMVAWFDGARANYVILHHGNGHYTWYWHLKRGSIAVTVGQIVTAGTQLGLAASSGFSTAPHLHFESRFAGRVYEPYAGACRAGNSYWVNQIPIRRELYVRNFAFTNAPLERFPGLPYEMPRTGTFTTSVNRNVTFWTNLHNLRANSTWRAKYLRPDGSVALDAGPYAFNNPIAYRWSWWWVRFLLTLNVTGTWRLQYSVNDQLLVDAPFQVVASDREVVNRPPNAVTPVFDPTAATTTDVLFCRLQTGLTLHDPDYDVVQYRYQWRINDQLVRDVTTAAHSDALSRGQTEAGDVVQCVVTPSDGLATGPSAAIQMTIGQ